MIVPVLALVGRPNVGKSTLFNRLTRSRDALVADFPGLTRDRKYGQGKIEQQPFIVIDTGGIDGKEKGIETFMVQQSLLAIDEADIVLFLVDGRAGLTAGDEIIAQHLREKNKKAYLVVNKIDGLDLDNATADFWQLGMNDVYQIAAAHGRGVLLMLQEVIEQFITDYQKLKKEQHELHLNHNEVISHEHTDNTDNIETIEDRSSSISSVRISASDKNNDIEEDAEYSFGYEYDQEYLDQLASEQRQLDEPIEQRPIKMAIIGRPNVGKSTLTNRILGEERVIVFDAPGTTRDSIYIPMTRDDVSYIIIDTAGIRRRKNINETVEKFSVIKTLKAIEDANVVLLVIDARENISDQDLSLLGYALNAGRSIVIVVNKWDGLSHDIKEQVKSELDRRLGFVDFAQIHFISALHGSGVGHLFESVQEAYHSATKRISTSVLTNVMQMAQRDHQPPMVRGRRVKLKYAHTGGHNPPIIVIHGNLVEELPESYKRYLMNYYRQSLNIMGTPIRIQLQNSENPFENKDKNKKRLSSPVKNRKRLLEALKLRRKS